MAHLKTNSEPRYPLRVIRILAHESHAPRTRLRFNFAWMLAGNIIYAACQWGVMIALARLGSPVLVGQFAFGLAVTAPVMMFSNLQLRSIQATDAHGQFMFADYLALRWLTIGAGLIVIAAIVCIRGYEGETALVIIALALGKGCESFSDILYGLLQKHERLDRVAKSMILKGLLSLVSITAAVRYTGSAAWGAAALVAAWATILVGYDLPCAARELKARSNTEPAGFSQTWTFKPQWNSLTLRRLTWLALPLGFVVMFISVNSNLPRYFLEGLCGERELGIFASLAYFQIAAQVLADALAQSVLPRLSNYFAQGDAKAFRSLVLRLVAFGTVLATSSVVVAWIAGRSILTLVYGAEYARNAHILVWVMLAAGIAQIASFVGYAITAARCLRSQSALLVMVFFTALIASYWLIPRYRVLGAALTLLATSVTQLALAAMVLARALQSLTRTTNLAAAHAR